MMYKIISLTICCFLTAAMAMSASAAPASGAFEHLKTGPINGQNHWQVSVGNKNGIVVENSIVHSGKQAVEFKPGQRNKLSKWIGFAKKDVAVHFAFKVLSGAHHYIQFAVLTSHYKNLANITFNGKGQIISGSGKSKAILQGRYKTNVWNTVSVVLNRKARTMDMFVNGQLAGSSILWLTNLSGKDGQPRIIYFAAANQKPVYIDSFTITGAARKIPIDLTQVRKNLQSSVLGVCAGDYATMQEPANYQWLVTKGKKQFAKWIEETGIGVFRLINRHGWSIRGEQATKECNAIISAQRAAGNPKKMQERYQKAMKSKRSIWFDPNRFYGFAKKRGIKIIAGLGTRAYYDPNTKQAHWLVDNPKYYDGAAQNAAYYVKWAKDHGYLNTVVAWEIGNECYWFWNPRQYAAYVKKVIAATRKIDPNIKLCVSMYAYRKGDPDAAWYKNPQQRMVKAASWVRPMFKELGDDAKYITYGIVHLYGAEKAWNCNYKGLETYVNLIHSIPNASHLQLICDEWRSRATENMTIQRRYDIGGLWKAKFSLLLMSLPQFHYSATLSMFWDSGLGTYSDGHKWWAVQVLPDGGPVNAHHIHGPIGYATRYMPNPTGKRLSLGPYAAAMRMCNDIIKTDPLMLQHHAELGKMASAKFYVSRRPSASGAINTKGEGLEWLISTNKSRTSIAAIIINTQRTPARLRLNIKGNRQPRGLATIESYTCAPDKVSWTSTPGSISPKYDNGYLQDVTTAQPAGQVIAVPAFGMVKVVMPIAKK